MHSQSYIRTHKYRNTHTYTRVKSAYRAKPTQGPGRRTLSQHQIELLLFLSCSLHQPQGNSTINDHADDRFREWEGVCIWWGGSGVAIKGCVWIAEGGSLWLRWAGGLSRWAVGKDPTQLFQARVSAQSELRWASPSAAFSAAPAPQTAPVQQKASAPRTALDENSALDHSPHILLSFPSCVLSLTSWTGSFTYHIALGSFNLGWKAVKLLTHTYTLHTNCWHLHAPQGQQLPVFLSLSFLSLLKITSDAFHQESSKFLLTSALQHTLSAYSTRVRLFVCPHGATRGCVFS